MGKRLIIATGNQNKMREIREILADTGYEIVSMKEAGIDVDIVEDGKTFEENAIIKAKAVAMAAGVPAVADDSGLVVDALDGAPGIYSSRFMGEDTSYDIKNQALIDMVDDFCDSHRELDVSDEADAGTKPEPDSGSTAAMPAGSAGEERVPGKLREARFVCAVAAVWPDGTVKTVSGIMEGRVAYAIAGENGFGYDPIFYLPEYGKTSAEISAEEKNAISHRGKAFRALRDMLQEEDVQRLRRRVLDQGREHDEDNSDE